MMAKPKEVSRESLDALSDEFIVFLEANRMGIFGAQEPDRVIYYIFPHSVRGSMRGTRTKRLESATAEQRQSVVTWLEKHPEVKDFGVSELFDANDNPEYIFDLFERDKPPASPQMADSKQEDM